MALHQYRHNIYSHQQVFNPEFVRVIHDGVCNDQCEVLFKSEKYSETLYDEIDKRSKIGRHYSHEEMWYVFFMLARLAADVHGHGANRIVGNIHPKNILINENGEVKVITINSLPY